MRTYWAAKTGEPGEWIEIDLGAMKHIKAIQLNYYDHKSVQHNRANDLYYQYRIYSSDNGTDWTLAVDKSDNDKDVPHDYIELGETLDARYLKLETFMFHPAIFVFLSSGCLVMLMERNLCPYETSR